MLKLNAVVQAELVFKDRIEAYEQINMSYLLIEGNKSML